ncbi:MAG: hypothetical protein CSA09_03885 [Candidatus Contendobacter odensis]|uniref:histidine kinase n=1 Tax=Candidatus Contendibacter odensensis TaxID=1400860 RepID=A0A2G6PER8_9GAMM|nr:MAG: hypothetical protein CSA09_03885 [Candidatus Contendobacter odensis]
MRSLSSRLRLAASAVLATFLILTGLTLDQAFRDSTLAAVKERLKIQVFMLIGAADVDTSEHLTLPQTLPEARFSTPNSGLYADLVDGKGIQIWRSPSLLGLELPSFPNIRNPGETRFASLTASDGTPLFVFAFTVSWETEENHDRLYTFRVAESHDNYREQLWSFRSSLWGWLLAATGVLLAVQGLILRWGLKPLRRVAAEVAEIETGQRNELSSDYPLELQPLTTNLNTLICQSQMHLERYRNALGDLAHSLKTPLAVLRRALEQPQSALLDSLHHTLSEQLDRMNRTVDYQLQRAAAAGQTALSAPQAVAPTARKIIDSLEKVYADRALQLRDEIKSTAIFHGDEGDLLEILGNLADNACKWCQRQVVVRAYPDKNKSMGLVIEVEDDGAGIPPDRAPLLLNRGQRDDPTVAGHGIGLAVVRDLVEDIYHGKLDITRGALGGALIRAWLQFQPKTIAPEKEKNVD